MAFHESRVRSVAKAATFRVLIVLADIGIIYVITKNYKVALSVVVFSNIASTLIYIFHERAWNKVHWGKEKRKKSH